MYKDFFYLFRNQWPSSIRSCSDNFCHWLFVVVEELYGGLTEQSIEETIRSACLEDQEYLSIKQDVTRLFS